MISAKALDLLTSLDADAADPALTMLILQGPYRLRSHQYVDAQSLLPAFAWQTGGAIAIADEVLEHLETPWGPTDGVNLWKSWLVELRGGLDTFGRMCWFLRFGYTAAGLALARQMLERWTYNLGSSTSIWPQPREPYESYLGRVWATYSHMLEERDVGGEWATLSELLHGRSVELGGRSIRVSLDMTKDDRASVHELVVRVAELALRQVRGAIHTAAVGQGSPVARLLQARVDSLPATSEPDFLSIASPPLDLPFVESDLASTISSWGATYRGIIANRQKDPANVLAFPWMAIEERWCRAIDISRAAFKDEQDFYGDAFDPLILPTTLMRYRAVSEIANLASQVDGQAERAEALMFAAASLESAWSLWLQDLDESLICIRGVLEGAARARAHRVKPERAARLEARAIPPGAGRWLECAGWKRLAKFCKALDEFSHAQAHSRHERARELLTEIQHDATPEAGAYTARSHALEQVAVMLASEVAAGLECNVPNLAGAVRYLAFGTRDRAEADSALDEWLERGHAFSSYDFGPAVLSETSDRREQLDELFETLRDQSQH